MDNYHAESFLDDFVQFLNKRIDCRLQTVLTEDSRTRALETEIEGPGKGNEKLETEIGNLESKFDELESKFDELDSKFDTLESELAYHEDRIAELESEIEASPAVLKNLTAIVEREILETINEGRIRLHAGPVPMASKNYLS